MRSVLAAIALAGLALVGCGDGDDEVADDFSGEIADFPACDAFVGSPTQDAADYFDGGQCLRDDGNGDVELFVPGITSRKCVDDETLFWNDTGWGERDGTWQAHETDDLSPPDDIYDECIGDDS